MMKNIVILTTILMLTSLASYGQLGVGTTTPDPSAELEVKSTIRGFLPPRMTETQRNAISNPADGLLIFCSNCSGGAGYYLYYNSTWNSLANTDAQDLSLSGSTLSLTNDGTTVDLSSFLDNTDAQDLSLSGNTLSLSNDATSVNLSTYLDNTDSQDLSLSGNTLSLTNDGTSVDLSSFVNTDAQDLSLSGNTLSLTNDASSVNLSSYLDNTDNQSISRNGLTVTLSNGTGANSTFTDSVLTETQVDAFVANNGYLSSFTEVDGSTTNEIQNLNLSGNNLQIDGGSGVDLTSFKDNTDNQTIGRNGLTVTLSNGTGANTTFTDSVLSETQVDAFVSNNGYLTSFTEVDGSTSNEIQDLSLSGNTLSLSSDATTVNLSSYLDNTDAQDLSLSGNTLSLTNDASTVDLSSYVNTDNQDLSLSGNSLSLTNDASAVDLSGYLDNTDAQDLSLSGNTLSLTNDGSTVDLSSYVNTDNQDLSLSGNSLSLTNDASAVDLSGYLDNTDAQDLSLSGNTLSLTNDGSSVDLSSYLDNTDAQDLSLSGNTLSLTNDGSTVDLSAYLDADNLGNHIATQDVLFTENSYVRNSTNNKQMLLQGGVRNQGASVLVQGKDLAGTDKGGNLYLNAGAWGSDVSDGDIYMRYQDNGANRVNVTIDGPTGNMRIGQTVFPLPEKLYVEGAIRMDSGSYTGISHGATTPVPAGGTGTMVHYRNKFYGWNGTNWMALESGYHTDGIQNTYGVGDSSLTNTHAVDGWGNVALGYRSLQTNTTGRLNTAIGRSSMRYNQTGLGNLAVGTGALENNTGGHGNVALGFAAGANSSGSNNVYVGSRAGHNATGDHKLYIENNALNNPLIGGDFLTNKVIINKDISTLDANGATLSIGGDLQLQNGAKVDEFSTDNTLAGNSDVAVPTEKAVKEFVENKGYLTSESQDLSLSGNVLSLTGDASSVDLSPLLASAGIQDLSISGTTLSLSGDASTVDLSPLQGLISTGSNDISGGNNNLSNVTSGGGNTAIGNNALKDLQTGSINTAVGASAIPQLTSGTDNVGMGRNSLNGLTTGSANTAIGASAGFNCNGSNNLYIGSIAGPPSAVAEDNKLYINYGSSASPLIGGDFSHDKVGINTAVSALDANAATLTVGGDIKSTAGSLNIQDFVNTTSPFGAILDNGYVRAGMELERRSITTNGTGIFNVGINTNRAIDGHSSTHAGGFMRVDTRNAGNSRFQWYTQEANAALTQVMTLSADGKLGLGGVASIAKLQVTSGISHTFNGQMGIFSSSSSQHGNYSYPVLLSIYADHRIAGSEFIAHSDKRIKEVIGQSDSKTDLETLMNIKITDYSFIDKFSQGNGLQKKVIAQELKEVYPIAVNDGITRAVPDIYEKAEMLEGWVILDTDLQVGDRVKILTETEEEVLEVIDTKEGAFKIEMASNPSMVFVYGREVNDFHTVDYDAVAMLNVSATQELAKKLLKSEAQVDKMKSENEELKAMLIKLSKRVDNMEGKIQNEPVLYSQH